MPSKSDGLQQKIERIMAEVPPLPKGFEEWIRKSAFKENKYIFYKKKQGLCSSCGQMVEVKKAKHKEPGRCPSCKAKIKYKAINKATRYEDTEIVSIMQKMPDGSLLIRYLRASLKFKEHSDDTSSFPEDILPSLTNPSMDYWEGSREIIRVDKNGKTTTEQYEELWDWNSGQCEWKKERKRSMYFNKVLLRDSNPFIYKRNLKGLLKNTKWKYSGLDHIKLTHINIVDYLHTYEKYPAIEMLSKLNYQVLLDQIIQQTCRWGGTSGILRMHEKRLGLSKNVLNTGMRLNLTMGGLEFITTLEELGKNLTDNQIMWAKENTHTEIFTQLLKWVSPQKIINYVEKNTDEKLKRGFTLSSSNKSHFVTTYRDYIEQCVDLKLDLKNDIVLFPKNLDEKHKELTETIKAIESETIDKGIKEQYEKWNEILSYQSGNMRIEVASSHRLIIDEGQALRHCVGTNGYSKNMAKGKNLILFLRKNDKPYYTIEFDHQNMKIIQNRGLKNKDTTKEVDKFINKWKVKKLMNIKEISKAI